MKKKVLIVEDDQTMADMVAYNLVRQDLDVEIARDGAEGLRAARSRNVSLAILDLMLPSLDGLQIASELHSQRPGLPILMLTARNEDVMKIKGFEAGVDDYLTKPFSMEELILRVKALLRRAPGSSDEKLDEISFGDLRLSRRDRRLWINDEELSLPAKEFELLSTLASEPGRLFTRIDLGERVWGFEHLGDTRTIDTHVKNVRRKLDPRSSFTYIETVRGSGYRFKVQPKA
ncbi:MAG: response regulator transcription factor [Actinomycetota bacterium]